MTTSSPEQRPPVGFDALMALFLLVTTASAIGLIVVYWNGGQVQLEGLLLALALGSLAVALALWSRYLMPQGPETEDRPVLESSRELRKAVIDDLDRGEGTVLRRRVLATMLGAAVSALGLAAVVPLRSLAPKPLPPDLASTAWRRGRRLVDEAGKPVDLARLDVDSILTVFPEGASEQDKEDSQVLLLRVAPGVLQLDGDRSSWTQSGYVAFSKVCTHAGCPVGLYQAETHQLVCPCHQSLFDVTTGAEPVFGPATRPLPQLPLEVVDGELVAGGDFPDPIGPGYWTWGQR
jgi:ubiquinol-cytochrome c reductase iron-sulfur subunit